MPLSGGEADKLGNSYEADWTVRCLLRVLDEKARSVYLEPLGEEGEGVEFILTTSQGVREFHQVKRQRADGWRIKSMIAEGILTKFYIHLVREPAAHCVFVSQDPPGDLRDLSECARRAPDARQFESHYLRSADRSAGFALLSQCWGNISPERTFDLLRRIFIQGSDETTLREDMLDRAATLVQGTPDTVVSSLWRHAFESIRKTLDASALWGHLEGPERGFARRVWNNDPHLLQRIEEANQSYLATIRPLDILGSPIPRQEAVQAMDLLRSDSGKRGLLLSGGAGSGKTGVVAEVVERAKSEGWLALAFRLDRLETYGNTVRQLGEQLGLPDSPVTVLAEVAGDRPCMLVIDQLDAVSTTSGRNPAFFERVEELLRQCARYPHLRVVLACRKFDIDNDDRLRRLIDEKTGFAQSVPVGLLEAETVQEVVRRTGADPTQLNERQKTFLATPLHLKLFTEVGAPLSFESLKDLYDIYWDNKRDAVKRQLKRTPSWNQVLDLLLSRMVGDQALSAPEAVVKDEYPDDLEALLTEGILVRDHKRLAFFHETFFDYAFARRFVGQGESLLPFLLSQEQHLFLRGIVRQVLTHERAEDFGLYLADLRALLESNEVRFHLKRLIFQWLRSITEPTPEEWTLVQSLGASPDQDVARWSGTVINAPAWFLLLDRIGWIQEELNAADEQRVMRAFNYMAWHARDVPTRVAEIILPWADQPEPWPDYAARILSNSEVEHSHLFIDLYAKLIAREELSEQPPFASSGGMILFYDLPDKRPEWAIEIFAEWLIHFIIDRARMGQVNPLHDRSIPYGRKVGGLDDRLDLMVAKAPAIFAERILPIVLELIRRNAVRDNPKPWPDAVWPYYSTNDHYDLDDQLLEAVVQALQHLAAHAPDIFRVHAEEIHQYLDFKTAGWILARAYTANGEEFAEEAAAFIASSTAWLDLGYMDSSHWVSRELIAAITPYCPDSAYEALESTVLDYYPLREQLNRRIGRTQLALLNGFELSRRSPTLKRRLGELQRKFGYLDDGPPIGIQGGFVGPPFSAKWEKMSDAQWLNAIRKYATERDHPRDFLRGGADQLASVLQQQTTADPKRFAQLLCSLPPDANQNYFDAILRGVKEAATKEPSTRISPSLVWKAVRYCFSLPDHPCGRWIASLVSAYASEEVPQDVLESVAWYATKDLDPAEEIWLPSDTRTTYYGGDAASAGLNSVRGGMAWPVASLLFEHPDYFEFFEPYLEQMVNDPSFAVRTQVAYALLPVLNIDRSKAVNFFLNLCNPPHPALLKSQFVIRFLSYAIWTHFDVVYPLIKQMLASIDAESMRFGAQLAFMAAFVQPEAESLATMCVTGSDQMREGVAEVAAVRFSHPEDRARCEAALLQLFNDKNDKVRRAATNCFREMQGEQLASASPLIEGFIDSVAFQNEAFSFFHALEKATVPLPDVICRAFEVSASLMQGIAAGEAVRSGRFADRETHLLIRLYERTKDESVRRRCLDIIDALARTEAAYNIENTLMTREL